MTYTKRMLVAASLAAGMVVAGSPAAAAGKRVVVLDIDGTRDTRLQRSIEKLVRGEHKMVSAKQFMRTAKRLRVRKLNTDAIAKVCGRMAVDAVVRGTLISDADERYVLRLRVQEGASGRTVKKVSIRLSNPRLSSKMRRAVRKRLLSGISRVNAIADETAPEDDAEEDTADMTGDDENPLASDEDDEDDARAVRNARKAKKRRRGKARKRAVDAQVRRKSRRLVGASQLGAEDEDEDDTPRRVAAASDEDGITEDTDGDDEPASSARKSIADEIKMTPAERARSGALRVGAGLSVMSRALSFTSRADFMEAPGGYAGPATPGARVTAEIFPLAMDKKKQKNVGATKFGVGFMLDRAIGMTTGVAGATESADLETTMQRYRVSMVYRHNFGDKETSPTLRASVGYNKLKFRIDRTNAPTDVIVDLPNTLYKFVDPGLEVRYPMSPTLALNVAGSALLVLDAGAVQTPEEYGSAKLTGFDASVGIDYLISDRMLLTMSGHLTAIGFEFNGDGMQTTSRDGDDTTVDVGGALDRYVGASATLGYLF